MTSLHHFALVPATYPNRAIRRAVCKDRWNRLPGEWRAFLNLNPALVAVIKRNP